MREIAGEGIREWNVFEFKIREVRLFSVRTNLECGHGSACLTLSGGEGVLGMLRLGSLGSLPCGCWIHSGCY